MKRVSIIILILIIGLFNYKLLSLKGFAMPTKTDEFNDFVMVSSMQIRNVYAYEVKGYIINPERFVIIIETTTDEMKLFLFDQASVDVSMLPGFLIIEYRTTEIQPIPLLFYIISILFIILFPFKKALLIVSKSARKKNEKEKLWIKIKKTFFDMKIEEDISIELANKYIDYPELFYLVERFSNKASEKLFSFLVLAYSKYGISMTEAEILLKSSKFINEYIEKLSDVLYIGETVSNFIKDNELIDYDAFKKLYPQYEKQIKLKKMNEKFDEENERRFRKNKAILDIVFAIIVISLIAFLIYASSNTI
jgi:hypothetical protein